MNRALPAVSLFFLALAIIPQAGAAAAPLEAPTGLAATAASGSEIALSWEDNNSPAPKSFSIVRSQNSGSGFVEIAQVSRNVRTYLDMGLSFSTTYYYKVQALGTTNKPPSPFSAVAGATTMNGAGDNTPPSVPQNLTARGSTCISARVEWSPSTDSEAGVAGYRVFRDGQLIATSAFNYYNDWNLPEQTSFTYQVEAYDASDNISGRSNSAVATTLTCPDVNPPSEPAWISADDVSCTEVLVSWAAATDVGTGVAAYEVMFFGATLPLVNGSQTSLLHTNPYFAGYTLNYSVRAIDGHGNYSTTAGPTAVTVQTCGGGGNQPPVASAGPDQTVNLGSQVSFNGSGSNDPDGSITSYVWDFGDGTATSGVTANHIYSAPGSYTATLTVTDNSGATDTDTALVDVVTSDAAGDFIWSKDFGGSGPGDSANSADIAVGPDDSVVVVGNFSGSVAVDGAQLPTLGDLFIVKYKPDGRRDWARSFSANGLGSASAVAVDDAGDIFVTGSFYYPLDLGGNTLVSAGNFDVFLAKYSPNGTHLWSMALGDFNAEQGVDVAIDVDGNLFLAGVFRGTMDLQGQTLTSVGNNDIFVAKLTNSDGGLIWARSGGGTGTDAMAAIATGPDGSVAITGYFKGSANFGGGTLVSAGNKDVFLVEYNSNGSHLWSKRFGGSTDDEGRGLAIDPINGEVAIIGTYSGAVDFGDGVHPDTGGGLDMFLARYTAGGQNLWAKGFGDSRTSSLVGNDVGIDTAGNVVMTGNLVYTVNLGGEWLIGSTGDVVVAKYDMDGAHLWSYRYGELGNDVGTAIDCDSADNVVTTGYFDMAIDFGGTEHTSPGSLDGFVVKLSQ